MKPAIERPEAIIFDLDQTMVDSRAAQNFRRVRRWPEAYSLIPSFIIFDGVMELLAVLGRSDIPAAIVTSSPQSYASRVLKHFNIRVAHLVCYHDTRLHKPDPAPIQLAIERLGIEASRIWSIGDEAKDVVASRAAGTVAGGALWGALDRAALDAAAPDFVDAAPLELVRRLERLM